MLDRTHKLATAAAKGDRANAKLQDEVFRDALKQLEADYIEAWKGATEGVARENLWHMVKALENFERHLVTVVNDGKLARSEIEAMSRIKAA